MSIVDSFRVRATLDAPGRPSYYSLPAFALSSGLNVSRLPFSLRILLENLLRHEDGKNVTRSDILALAEWQPRAEATVELSFRPARVVLQDFTGVPAVVDLAAMRDAIVALGGDPQRINPLFPAELVIDHSVQVDEYGTTTALARNTHLDFARNQERYQLLRWGQQAFRNFAVVPPGMGIVHQVNLEYLARVVFEEQGIVYPDSLVGTDSHTTMINGLGVLGWGVGGIEAEAAMLGLPISLLVPQVLGCRLLGKLPEGATATDLVLTITELLRTRGVVGQFVEFFGEGLEYLPLADRATVANMAPEFGSTCALFPIDRETLRYLEFSGRSHEQVQLVEAYAKAQGWFHASDTPVPEYSDVLTLDLATVVPCVAGPRRPQDRVALVDVPNNWNHALPHLLEPRANSALTPALVEFGGEHFGLRHGHVVIAAITSCTNTSNPSVMMAAGLLARKATQRGLTVRPWVKTSLAPGSQVVTEYLAAAGVLADLEKLRFHVVGYGCTTCIGNSGPLPEPIATAVEQNNLVVASVLSGNRNFEGRINPLVRANYLASPPLVVAYALAGRIEIAFDREPLGTDVNGAPVFLRDVWPSSHEISEALASALNSDVFRIKYGSIFQGPEAWQRLTVPTGECFEWSPSSTYVRRPTFLDGVSRTPSPLRDIVGARVLALLGDSITTDHISPAGSIAKNSAAAKYLVERGVAPGDFNSYGARRGNHEVMVRGTFANVRLRNRLVPGVEGGFTMFHPTNEVMSIFDAAERYQKAGTPLVILAGKEYGTGSSRDWAAKGTFMLGAKAVIAESFERIHRSNLVGMGVLPLQFMAGESADTLHLTGSELLSLQGIATGLSVGQQLRVEVTKPDGSRTTFGAIVRIDTAGELEYFTHGGILPYVMRQFLHD